MTKWLTVRRLSFVACALNLLAFGSAVVWAETPLIIAHRGASHEAPENTISAFRLAWEEKADGIEGDFYLSKDGQIVCIHDKTTKRTANKDLSVADSTLAELRQLDVGTWKSPKYAGERIPTLSEVLAIVPDGKLIYVEIKCGPEIVPYLSPVFKASGLPARQIRIIAFDENVVDAVKRQIPEVKAYWLTSYKQDKLTQKWKPTPAAVRKTLKQVKADGLGTQAETSVVDQTFVKALRKGGWEFHAWTIDEIPEAQQFQTLGVDSITTNRPAFLRKNLGAGAANSKQEISPN
jgi:glycerophosphoryl diester phosphodiesterase